MKALAAALALSLAACASPVITPPEPSLDTVQAVRQSDFPAMRVGNFGLGPNVSPAQDKSVNIRGLTVVTAQGGSFAGLLRGTLEADLRAAGRLDPAAPFVLQGVLTGTDVDSTMGTARGSLGAKFTLLKDGKTVFEKTLTVDASWHSSFVGAEAIPDAIYQYTGLFDKLAVKLLTDSDFRAAAH